MADYKLTKKITKLFLQTIMEERSLTSTDIASEVEAASQNSRTGELDLESKKKMIRELEYEYQSVVGRERDLVGADEDWVPWLPAVKGEKNWKYWERYRTLLAQNAFNDDVLYRLDRSTDKVLGYLGDPDKSDSWDRRGLVVGLVQSGKTAHYVGTINKAIDAGYQVIVILTGFTESLRYQTQVRIENGLLGYSLVPDAKDPRIQRKKECGVGLITPDKDIIESVTTQRSDFNTATARNFAISVGGKPMVFVIKKNASVLRNLLQWVNNFGNAKDEYGRNYVEKIPLLVIDDESDVGSIDTKKGAFSEEGEVNEDHDPTKLNKQIRKLLSLFDQSSYVGYTATPFANVLIHDLIASGIDNEDGLMIGEDLFPRSFIVSLPTPSNHIGPSVVFGSQDENGEFVAGLPILRTIDDNSESDGFDSWMPSSHKKDHVPLYMGKDTVPPTLYKAILSFILTCSIRRLRGDVNVHNSMLVHVTRFVDVQHRIYEQIDFILNEIVSKLRNRTADKGLLNDLKELWDGDENSYRATTELLNAGSNSQFHNATHEWNEVYDELLNAASAIEVRKINGESGDLDYDSYPDGLNVIAIGGDKLARGLTLEGLSASYFLRCSKMYDTLMQMGRWFGYRAGYLDLCRLYTTQGLHNWFYHIAEATRELRSEFDVMADSGSSPKQFGLKVRSHPQMLVTSAVKMRYGESIQLSFQGSLLQTIDFNIEKNALERNYNAMNSLVRNIESTKHAKYDSVRSNALKWSNVPGSIVVEFLSSYLVHKNAKTIITGTIKEYIEKQMRNGGLRNWTVLFSGGSGAPIKVGEHEIKQAARSFSAKKTDEIEKYLEENHFVTGVLTSPSDEKVDLTLEQVEKALEMDQLSWEESNGVRNGRKVKRPITPGSKYIRLNRPHTQGLLIIYPLDIGMSLDGASAGKGTMVGFALSFPSVADIDDTPVTYVVTPVYQRELDET